MDLSWVQLKGLSIRFGLEVEGLGVISNVNGCQRMSWAEYHCLRINLHASFKMILDCFACIWGKLVDNLVEMLTFHV